MGFHKPLSQGLIPGGGWLTSHEDVPIESFKALSIRQFSAVYIVLSY